MNVNATHHTMSGQEWLFRMQRACEPPLFLSSPPGVNGGTIKKETPAFQEQTTAIAKTARPRISGTMNGGTEIVKITRQLETSLSEIPWTRTVAAGSFVVGALLLLTGRRKSALAVSAAGAAVALLENPEIVRDAWNAMPRMVRASQDFLVRIEDFVEELNKQGTHIRKVIAGND
jgi:hypothetical protein